MAKVATQRYMLGSIWVASATSIFRFVGLPTGLMRARPKRASAPGRAVQGPPSAPGAHLRLSYEDYVGDFAHGSDRSRRNRAIPLTTKPNVSRCPPRAAAFFTASSP